MTQISCSRSLRRACVRPKNSEWAPRLCPEVKLSLSVLYCDGKAHFILHEGISPAKTYFLVCSFCTWEETPSEGRDYFSWSHLEPLSRISLEWQAPVNRGRANWHLFQTPRQQRGAFEWWLDCVWNRIWGNKQDQNALRREIYIYTRIFLVILFQVRVGSCLVSSRPPFRLVVWGLQGNRKSVSGLCILISWRRESWQWVFWGSATGS